VKVTFDNSPPSGRPGVLMGFIEWNGYMEGAVRSGESAADAVAALAR
jgi:hypothetical protein